MQHCLINTNIPNKQKECALHCQIEKLLGQTDLSKRKNARVNVVVRPRISESNLAPRFPTESAEKEKELGNCKRVTCEDKDWVWTSPINVALENALRG